MNLEYIEPIVVDNYICKLASTNEEALQCRKLRYEELILSYNNQRKNKSGIDKDEYDDVCADLIVLYKDETGNQTVVGNNRLISAEHLKKLNGKKFLTEEEFNIDAFKASTDGNILEVGRVIIHPDFRNGIVLKLLWKALGHYVEKYKIEFLIGTSCFHTTDLEKVKMATSYVGHKFLFDEKVRPYAIGEGATKMCFYQKDEIDMERVKKELPPLVRTYINIGARFGEGIYVDKIFGSIDFINIFEISKIDKRYFG